MPGETQASGATIDRAQLIDQNGAGQREAVRQQDLPRPGLQVEVIGQTTASLERS
jgi:hypothetical protein